MPGPGLLPDGWFREESAMWPGQGQGLKVDAVLYDAPTAYQHLTVFESDPRGPYGTVMTLDGAIQFTDMDEFVYHEMLANLSLTCHAAPRRVLVIGGGDGGVVREVLRHAKPAAAAAAADDKKASDDTSSRSDDQHQQHATVEHIDLVDIDGDVVEQSKRHFPQIACGLSDARVHVTIGDGAAYVANTPDKSYDVVIIDTTDPEGPASELFGVAFYRHIMRILRDGGIVCNQGESIWLHRPLIERMMRFLRDDIGFASVKYALMHIPTYPCGSIGTLVCAKSPETNVLAPLRPVEATPSLASQLRYYNSDVHKAAYVLPAFAAYLNKQ